MQENKSQGYRRLSLAPRMAENTSVPYLGTSERAWIWFATLSLPWFVSPLISIRPRDTREPGMDALLPDTSARQHHELPPQHLSRGTTRELVILLGVRKVGWPQRSPSSRRFRVQREACERVCSLRHWTLDRPLQRLTRVRVCCPAGGQRSAAGRLSGP